MGLTDRCAASDALPSTWKLARWSVKHIRWLGHASLFFISSAWSSPHVPKFWLLWHMIITKPLMFYQMSWLRTKLTFWSFDWSDARFSVSWTIEYINCFHSYQNLSRRFKCLNSNHYNRLYLVDYARSRHRQLTSFQETSFASEWLSTDFATMIGFNLFVLLSTLLMLAQPRLNMEHHDQRRSFKTTCRPASVLHLHREFRYEWWLNTHVSSITYQGPCERQIIKVYIVDSCIWFRN